MLKLKIKDLKNKFNDEKTYKEFLTGLENLLNSYKFEYQFLALKEETWHNLITRIVKNNINKLDIGLISMCIKTSLQNYIKDEIAANKPRIISNLLIMISKQKPNYKTLIKQFFRKLELLEIKINETYYKALKEYSSLLKRALQALGVFDFTLLELKRFFNAQNDYYDKFICQGLTTKENRDLLDYVLSLFPNNDKIRTKIKNNKKDDDYRKIHLFISNYNIISQIHKLLHEHLENVDDKEIDECILKYSYKDLEKLFEQYQRYSLFSNDLTFIYKLINHLNSTTRRPVSNKTQNQNNNPTNESQAKRGRKRKKLYTRFPAIDGTTPEEQIQIINILLHKYDKKHQDLVNDYVDDKLPQDSEEEKQAKNIISTMQRHYKTYGKNLLDPKFTIPKRRKSALTTASELPIKEDKNNSDTLPENNKEKEKSKIKSHKKPLYTRFPLFPGITNDKRIEIINLLLQRRTIKTQNLINDYIDGKLEKNSILSKRAKKAIVNLQSAYKKYCQDLLDPNKKDKTKRANLYNRFPIQKNMTEEEHKKIVDILFNTRTPENRTLINDYISGKMSSKDPKCTTALSNISTMKRLYHKHGKNILNPEFKINPKRKMTLDDLFPLNKNITKEARTKIIDNLLSKYDEDTKDAINNFINGLISKKDKIYSTTYNKVKKMRKIYQKYGIKLLDLKFVNELHKKRRPNIYENFPLLERMTVKERKQIVDILFKRLSTQHQKLVNNYLAGLLKSKTKDYKTAERKLNQMKKLYHKHGKLILNPNFKFRGGKNHKMNLYERFPIIPGMTCEERNKIVDYILKTRYAKTKNIIIDYLENKITTGDQLGKKAVANIQAMQRYYKKHISDLLIIIRHDSKDLNKRKFLENFPLNNGITEDERNQIIAKLITTLGAELEELYEDFLNDKLSKKKNKLFKKRTEQLVNFYKHHGKNILNPDFNINRHFRTPITSIYDYFPVQEGMTDKERNQIVYIIFSEKTKEEQENIISYNQRKLIPASPIYKKTHTLITTLQKKYYNYGKIILMPEYKLSVAKSYFYKILGINMNSSEFERNNAVNTYLAKLNFNSYDFNYLQFIINLISLQYDVDLQDLDQNKKALLHNALKIIEYVYRNKLGMTKEEYLSYFLNRILEIYNLNFDLETLIKTYIDMEHELVLNRENKINR